jgi:hypothetical protein
LLVWYYHNQFPRGPKAKRQKHSLVRESIVLVNRAGETTHAAHGGTHRAYHVQTPTPNGLFALGPPTHPAGRTGHTETPMLSPLLPASALRSRRRQTPSPTDTSAPHAWAPRVIVPPRRREQVPSPASCSLLLLICARAWLSCDRCL